LLGSCFASFCTEKETTIEKRQGKEIDNEALKNDIELYPDSYCYERAVRFGVSSSGIRDAQYRLGVKKL